MFFSGVVTWLLENVWLLLSHVGGRSSFPRPLSPEKEKQYIEAAQGGDEAAKRTLVEHNLRLVAHIAKKYSHASLEFDDMVSIGTIGLIKAVSTFKPANGTQLATYASRCVENEILMALRATRKQRNDVSLSDPIGKDREGNEIMLLDVLGTDSALVEDAAEMRIETQKAVKLLSSILGERERTVLIMRYGLIDGVGRPQHEVAKALGISRSYVSRIEKKAIGQLYRELSGLDNSGPEG